MRKMNFFGVAMAVLSLSLLVISCATTAVIIPPEAKQIKAMNFNNHRVGDWYTLEKMAEDWNPRLKNGDEAIDFKGIIHNRAIVAENKQFDGNVLKVFLPKGKFSPTETGAQIYSDIGGHEEIYFGVSIYLPLEFECGKEIKIPPGIYSGWKFSSGAVIPDGVKIGPTVRAVLQNCQAKSYIYHLNQKGNNDDGSSYGGNPVYGDKFSWKHDGKSVILTKGVKHEIVFYVRMNTPGKKDGRHKVWYDGELVLSLDKLEFRKVPELKFDTVGVEIFRGGNDQSYITPHDNTLDVSDFGVYVRD